MKKTLSKNILKTLALVCLVVVFASIAGHAFAGQVDNFYTPLSPLPDLKAQDLKLAESVSFDTYVTYLFNLLIALGAVAAVLMITWGGFEYMTSDAVNGKKDGLAKIKNAIYGLLLVLSSVLILRTINPQFIIVPPGLVPPAGLAQPTTSAGDWMSQLNEISADYQKASAEAIKAKTEAKAVYADLENQANIEADDAAIACDGNESSPECIAATTKSNELQDKKNTALSNLSQKTFSAFVSAGMNSTFSGGEAVNGTNGANTNTFAQSDLTTIDKERVAINNAYDKAVGVVQQSGNDAAILEEMRQEKSAADAQLLVQKYLVLAQQNSMSTDQAITNIKQLQTTMDGQLSNEVYIQQFDKNVETVLTQLNNKKAIQDAPIYQGPH